MFSHAAVDSHLTADPADQSDTNRRSARPLPIRITRSTERVECAHPPRSAGATRGTARSLPGLVASSGNWLLPLMCVFLVAASIAYEMNTAFRDTVTSTAVKDGSRAESITPSLDLQDDLAVELAGSGQTARVITQPYLGLGIEPEQDPQTPAQLQAAALRSQCLEDGENGC
jgi:hypothetical protein